MFSGYAVLEIGGSQNWPCPWISSYLSAKFIGHLLKIIEDIYVWGKVTVLLQMQVIKFKVHLGTCLLMSHSDHLFVSLTFDEL